MPVQLSVPDYHAHAFTPLISVLSRVLHHRKKESCDVTPHIPELYEDLMETYNQFLAGHEAGVTSAVADKWHPVFVGSLTLCGDIVYPEDDAQPILRYWIESRISLMDLSSAAGKYTKNTTHIQMLKDVIWAFPSHALVRVQLNDALVTEYLSMANAIMRYGYEKGNVAQKIRELECVDFDDLLARAAILMGETNAARPLYAFYARVHTTTQPNILEAIRSAWNNMNVRDLPEGCGIPEGGEWEDLSAFRKFVRRYINMRDSELPIPLCIANGAKSSKFSVTKTGKLAITEYAEHKTQGEDT